MTNSRKRRLFFGAIGTLCAMYLLFELAIWTLPQFEDTRARRRLSRIPGVGILHHVDNCGVWLTRPVRQQDVEALGDGLSHLPDIEYFSIGSQCSLTPDGYAALTRAKSVETLKIHGQTMDADDMMSIARIPGLGTLWLQDTGFPGGSLAQLNGVLRLHTLVISCGRGEPRATIDKNDIDVISEMTSLKELSLFGVDLRESLVEELGSRRSDLKILWPRPLTEERLLEKLRAMGQKRLPCRNWAKR